MRIGFTGKAGAGKDTCADYLVTAHNFTKLSWAGPLKAGLTAMGFPEPANREDKEKLIPGFDFSWREAAQRLGTEWGRELDPDIWVKAVGQRMAQEVADRKAMGMPLARFVFSDVRFENEASMIRQGGVVVHLTGRAVDLGGLSGHASEAGIAHLAQDLHIDNSRHVSELYQRLDGLVRLLRIEGKL